MAGSARADAVLHQIVKAHDIRGLVETQLDAPIVEALGAAIADEFVEPRGSARWRAS